MTRVDVAKLKANLQHYLRLAQRGEHVVVLDGRHPVARLTRMPAASVWQRLAAEGRCKLGSQRWGDIEVPKLKNPVPIEEIMARHPANR